VQNFKGFWGEATITLTAGANGSGRVLLFSRLKGDHAERGAMMLGRKTFIGPTTQAPLDPDPCKQLALTTDYAD